MTSSYLHDIIMALVDHLTFLSKERPPKYKSSITYYKGILLGIRMSDNVEFWRITQKGMAEARLSSGTLAREEES